MSGWTPWRRNPAPIRALADETPKPERGPGTRSRCGTCARPISWRTSHMWGNRWVHDGIQEDADDHEAAPAEAGRWEPRHDDDVAAAPKLLQTDPTTSRNRILREQLHEVTTDRNRLELVNDRLRARIRELEAASGDPAETTLVMPRTRSGPPPVVRRGR